MTKSQIRRLWPVLQKKYENVKRKQDGAGYDLNADFKMETNNQKSQVAYQ